MSTSPLPAFYKSVFRVWNLLRKERREQADSLYWILQEPVLWGTRLDLPSWAGQNLTTRLQTAGVVTLGQVVALTGPRMDDPSRLAAQLGLTSVRVTQKLLEHWKQRLTGHDRLLLNSSFNPTVKDDDPFPAIFLAPDFKDCSGILMEHTHLAPLDGTTGKTFYRILVKAINKTKLDKRPDTPWRRYLQLAPAARPEWRSFYKPPLSKKHADIHWRVLHGVIAVNSFVSTINPAVEDKCPYCDQRETVFHCFYECLRLLPLFLFLQTVFTKCGEVFTKQLFILGFKYTRQHKNKCQLLNFVLGQAKMAVYFSRRRKVEDGFIVEPVTVCINMMKSRLLIDFNYFKAAGDLDSFQQVWCFNQALCSVENHTLQFGDVLM